MHATEAGNSGGIVSTITAAAPRVTAWTRCWCPSLFAPRRATNKEPGPAWRES